MSVNASSSVGDNVLYASSEHADVSSCWVAWRYESWLNTFPLTVATVMDYFKHSSFYDSQCTNQTAAMQQMTPQAMTALVGVEYALDAHCTETYFLIRKCYRSSPTALALLSLYYVVAAEPASARQPARGTVFQMPNVYAVAVTALTTAQFHVNNAVAILRGATSATAADAAVTDDALADDSVDGDDDGDESVEFGVSHCADCHVAVGARSSTSSTLVDAALTAVIRHAR